MKNALILFSTLLLVYLPVTSLYAQFPENKAEWIVYHTLPVLGAFDDFRVYRDFMPGDTQVYKGKVYKKIYTQNLCRCFCSFPNNYGVSLSNIMLLGGVRQDSGRVYFTRFGNNMGNSGYFYPFQDTLLFDLNLELSDTIMYRGQKFFVYQTDGDNINLMLSLNNPDRLYWNRKSGSRYGILAQIQLIYTTSGCFSTEQPSTCVIPCAAITSVETPQQHALGVKIIPGMSENQFILMLPEALKQVDCRIFTAEGRLLAEERALENQSTITLPQKVSGILFFHLQTADGQTGVQKVLSQ